MADNPDALMRLIKRVCDVDRVDGAHGGIQWKGTDVCIDLHCPCGYDGHVDGEFFYAYQCPACGQVYHVGRVVRLYPATEEERDLILSGK